MKITQLLALLVAFWLPRGIAVEPQPIVVATYNVENYLGEEAVATETGARRSKPKSENAIEAMVQVIK
ncbi:MAG: hypothetical protein ACAI37_28200, partial [Chthoniobacter sp.]